MGFTYPKWSLPEDSRGRVRIHPILNVLLHPIYEGALYLLTVVTAGFLTLNGFAINQAFRGEEWTSILSWALGLVLSTVIFHGLNRWAVLVQREAAAQSMANVRSRLLDETDNLLEETTQLRWLVQTMPPKGFLDELGTVYSVARNAAGAILETGEDVEANEVKRALRIVLNAYADAARRFDGDDAGSYYANIMVYYDSDDITAESAKAYLENNLLLERPEISIGKLRGVLHLRTDLAIRTGDDGAGPHLDDTLPPIVLSIPHEKQNANGKSYLLPGAPRAWYRRKADAYLDTDELLDWYIENCVRDEYVENEIQEYFSSETSDIGSLVSYSLSYNEGNEDELTVTEYYHPLEEKENGSEQPIGVLNIHRNSSGILRNDSEISLYFHQVMRPLRILATRLLYKLKEVEEDKYETWKPLANEDQNSRFQKGPHDKSQS